jgi:hypothetical protein
LREGYGIEAAPSVETGNKDFSGVLTQTVCDIKTDT